MSMYFLLSANKSVLLPCYSIKTEINITLMVIFLPITLLSEARKYCGSMFCALEAGGFRFKSTSKHCVVTLGKDKIQKIFRWVWKSQLSEKRKIGESETGGKCIIAFVGMDAPVYHSILNSHVVCKLSTGICWLVPHVLMDSVSFRVQKRMYIHILTYNFDTYTHHWRWLHQQFWTFWTYFWM